MTECLWLVLNDPLSKQSICMSEPIQVELTVPSFGIFILEPGEAEISVTASVKKRGRLYFLTTKIKRTAEGAPRPAVFSNRIETFQGKAVQGKLNVVLEEVMDKVHEVSLEWARTNWKAPLLR